MQKKRYISSLFLALCTTAFSQNAPVSTTTTVLPPFSIHMFENLRSDRDKFIVTVTLRDLTQTEGQVRLRLRMESFTHAMQTRRGAATPVHTLIPGVPLRLTNDDLRVYFLEQNLEFTNMPLQLYRNNATVPEGHYRIWFEVYEARTGAHVSRGSEVAAHLHIVQHDVPLINLPQQNATIHLPESGLQHVVFQWAPRHFGPGMLTEYRLQIVEVPPGMNPEQVMHATLIPFFETTTMATSFVFNHTHPPMRLGFTYAFRVQARLRGPDEGMSMFKNNGFTPTQWFTFSQRCPELRNVRVEPINQFAVWVHYMDHPLYERVRFRRRLDRENAIWHYITGNQNPLLVSELRPEQGYQYQMMAYCAFEYSNWTPIRTFTTPPAPPPRFECGAEDTTPPLVNTGVPLGRPLQRGDIVRLPQNSELIIRESTGTGPFRGYGTVFFNLFNASLIMTFEALEVDDEMQWITGELISRHNRDGRFIANLDRPRDQDQPPPPADTATAEVPIIIADNTDITITDSEGNLITENSLPPFTITITDPDGEDQQITVENLPAVITDGSGAEFVVNQDGTIERVPAGNEEEERSVHLLQPSGFLFVTVEGRGDTLFSGNVLTLPKQNTPIRLRVGYKADILHDMARSRVTPAQVRDRLEHQYLGWDELIQLDQTQWSTGPISRQGGVFEISEPGVYDFTVDATDAIAVMLRDSVSNSHHIKSGESFINRFTDPRANDTLTRIRLRIQVVDGGIAHFRPRDSINFYRNFGFDGAILPQLQQVADFGQPLTIGGIDYFVPRLTLWPNASAEIRLDYTSSNPPNFSSNIILRSNDERLLINGSSEDVLPPHSRNIRLETRGNITDSVTFVVNAYYALNGGEEILIGRLNVTSRNPIVRTIRVIRVRRCGEDDYAPFTDTQKKDLIDSLNILYRQAFVEFVRDTSPHQNTLAVAESRNEEIQRSWDIYSQLPETERGFAVHYIFIATPHTNSRTNGIGQPSGRLSALFNNSSITAAHELGHNLGLQHTFENTRDNRDGVLNVGNRTLKPLSTRNIMDYTLSGETDRRRLFFWYQIRHIMTR